MKTIGLFLGEALRDSKKKSRRRMWETIDSPEMNDTGIDGVNLFGLV